MIAVSLHFSPPIIGWDYNFCQMEINRLLFVGCCTTIKVSRL